MTENTGIKIENLTKTFDTPDGEIIAVDNLSIDIKDGEFIVFVGPSGCGKTTTLRCVAGLENPSSGEISLNGERINDIPPQQRDIGMVFQNYALYPHLSTEDNLKFGLRNSTSLPEKEIDSRINEIAELMGISDLLSKKPSELSGGQQQRVATGRAIVREPDVFLFDEPLSNLDAKLRAHMRTEIQQLQNELGITSIYVTHDQEEAMTMADRIVILKNGNLQQIGAPTEVYNKPRNTFVARFLGEPSINLFEAETSDGFLQHSDFKVSISEKTSKAINDRNKILFGVRPEDISISQNSSISGIVKLVEELGNYNLVYVQFSNDGDMCTILTNTSHDPEIESMIQLDFPDEVYLFDTKSGDSLWNQNPNNDISEATSINSTKSPQEQSNR